MARLGRGFRILARLCFPCGVLGRHADTARPVTSCPSIRFVEEEHPLRHITAPGDRPQGAGAVEPAIDATAPMAAESTGMLALVRLAVAADQCPAGFRRIAPRCAKMQWFTRSNRPAPRNPCRDRFRPAWSLPPPRAESPRAPRARRCVRRWRRAPPRSGPRSARCATGRCPA